MLDDRKLAVLRAIVEDYVSTNEPVGSKALVDRHNLDVSPATIRNDMAVLEEQGFIVQPHTSAGRIPTDKGYRLFVDRLSAVRAVLRGRAPGHRDLPGRRLRPGRRRDADGPAAGPADPAGGRGPVPVAAPVQRSGTSSWSRWPTARLLLVLITDTGRVEQRAVETAGAGRRGLDHPPAGGAERLPGRPAAGRGGRADRRPARADPAAGAAATPPRCSRSSWRPWSSGTRSGSWWAARPTWPPADFSRGLHEVLEALEEQVVLMRLLGESGDEALVTVRIGAENQVEGLREHLGGGGRLRLR